MKNLELKPMRDILLEGLEHVKQDTNKTFSDMSMEVFGSPTHISRLRNYQGISISSVDKIRAYIAFHCSKKNEANIDDQDYNNRLSA